MTQFKSIFDKDYPVTSGILLLTGAVFLALQFFRFGEATTSSAIYDFGGLLGLLIKADNSQLWRLLSAIFVHIGWEHFLFNGLAIYFLGRQVESLFGSSKFVLLYLLSGFMGNAFVLVLTPDVIVAGASTSIFGILASFAVLRFFVHNHSVQSLGRSCMILLILNILTAPLMPNISLVGHIGGAVGGAICAVFIPIEGEEGIFSTNQRRLALFAYLLLFLALVWRGSTF